MKHLFPLLTGVFLLFAASNAIGQETDVELWGGLNFSKKLKKDLHLGFAGQARTANYGRRVKAYFGEVNIGYKFNKYVKAGINYRHSKRPDSDSYTSTRHRYNGDLVFRYKKKPFTFGFRNRYQVEYDDLFKVENRQLPSKYYRFRPSVDYKINKKYVVRVGFEGYLTANNPAGNYVDNFRYILGLNRDLKRKRKVVFTYIMEQSANVAPLATSHILRVKYYFTL